MIEKATFKRKFRIKIDDVWYRRHLAIGFCIDPDIKGEIYLFIGLWRYDLSIGFLIEHEEDNN